MFSAIRGLLAFCIAVPCLPLHARTLTVGPGKAFAKPSAAAAAALDGDTVLIDTGTYPADAATWRANSLVIRSPGRYAHLRADGVHAQGKAIWVVVGKDCVIENIEFSGAKVPDGNGAGIRQEGANLTLRHCFFHDNENGILTNGGESEILIEYCEFAYNGAGDGFTHNMYIGEVASFTLRHSYSHHAKIGHNVKSRARKNIILYNKILDGPDGTASYSIDLPNGGLAVIMGNAIEQGPKTDNPTLVAYGAEGLKHPVKEIYLASNTLVNDRQGGTFLSVAGGTTLAKVANNLVTGPGTLVSGSADTLGNVITQSPGFVDRDAFDYRLTPGSPAVDRGRDAGTAAGLDLVPGFHFLDPHVSEPRRADKGLDVGAYELGAGTGIKPGMRRTGRARWMQGRFLATESQVVWCCKEFDGHSLAAANALGRFTGFNQGVLGFTEFNRPR